MKGAINYCFSREKSHQKSVFLRASGACFASGAETISCHHVFTCQPELFGKVHPFATGTNPASDPEGRNPDDA